MKLLSAAFEAAKAKLHIDSLSPRDLEALKEVTKSLIDQNLALREMYGDLMKETLPKPWTEKQE
jgi:hypothetical protein